MKRAKFFELLENAALRAENEVFGDPKSPNYIPEICYPPRETMNSDLLQVMSDPALHTGLNLSVEQQQIASVIQHHIVLQGQFEQLTKHCEILYTRLAAVEKLVQAKVLS